MHGLFELHAHHPGVDHQRQCHQDHHRGSGALRDLAAQAPLPAGAWVLDAGCGLGDGLKALREAYPAAQLHGLEWSWPLRWMCALSCPWAQIGRAHV
mgnify:CR=1 FL=1